MGCGWAFGLAMLLVPGSASAQAPLFLIDGDTEVASVEVVFEESRTLDLGAIRNRIALQGPGVGDRIRSAFDVLPLVETPEPHPFSPLEMGRDAKRIEQYYADQGFLDTRVEYEVRLDTASNAVDVTYRVHEGRPLLLDSLTVAPAPGTDSLAPRLRDEWARFRQGLRREEGVRLGEVVRLQLRSHAGEWLRDRGYPWATVTDSLEVDTADASAHLHLSYETGPLAVVDSVRIEGLESLSYRTVRREIPFRPGDEYSASRAVEGQQQVFGLGLVRLALLDVAPDQPRDSTVSLRLRLEEGQTRLIAGQLGYATERGVVVEGEWEHRDFLGAARTLTLAPVANTGWLAATREVDRRLGFSATLRQPYLFNYRVSGSNRPFVEYRDDTRDESVTWGDETTILYERGALKRASASLTVSARRVLEAPALTVRGDVPDTSLLSTLPVDIGTVQSTRLGIDWVFGEVDDPLAPREGFIARLGGEVAGPAAVSEVEYTRLEGQLTGLLKLGSRVGLVARVSAGRLLPRGQSLPDGPEEFLPTLLELRNAVFTAGGTGDVRGWGAGLLGPKTPDLRIVRDGDELRVSADRYVVLTGLARTTASLEFRLPFPFLGPRHATHLFLDAGRIWNPDDRFRDLELPPDPLAQEKFFYGTGLGVSFGTLVGPIRLDLGYKLNPSPLDVRDPGDVARALVTGRPVLSVPADQGMRWHLHLSVGRGF